MKIVVTSIALNVTLHDFPPPLLLGLKVLLFPDQTVLFWVWDYHRAKETCEVVTNVTLQGLLRNSLDGRGAAGPREVSVSGLTYAISTVTVCRNAAACRRRADIDICSAGRRYRHRPHGFRAKLHFWPNMEACRVELNTTSVRYIQRASILERTRAASS